MKKRGSFVIDLAGRQSPHEIQEAIAASLPVPEYYGRNLDALRDFLTEWGRMRVVFKNAGAAAVAYLLPACAASMSEAPGLAVVFDGRQRKWRSRPSDGRKARRRA